MPLHLSNGAFLTVLGPPAPSPIISAAPQGVSIVPKEVRQPFYISGVTGALNYTQNQSAILEQHLLDLIFTQPGERVMLPTYGVGAQKYLFESNDLVMTTQLMTSIRDQVSSWEPNAVIQNVNVQPVDPSTGEMAINVNFTTPGFPQIHQVVFDINGNRLET